MTQTALTLALASMQALPDGEAAPEWVPLLPAGEIRTFDGRGPYRVQDAQALIEASMADPRGALPIDENHATDLAAPKGGEAPARGWIKELQAREDGIWGRVEWTGAGRTLVADKAYRGISPVFIHDKAGAIHRIARASLTNYPNLRGLPALHQEDARMGALMTRLAALLGLPEDATEDRITGAVEALKGQGPALQSQLAEIGTALGVAGAAPGAVVEAARALQAQQAQVAALQSEVQGLRKKVAEDWWAGQIAAKRAIPADRKDALIALHMQDAAQADQIAALYPALNPTATTAAPPAGGDGTPALNAEQLKIAEMLGQDPAEFAKALAADRKEQK